MYTGYWEYNRCFLKNGLHRDGKGGYSACSMAMKNVCGLLDFSLGWRLSRYCVSK